MKTVAIIQARSGSTRLPNKIFKDLCGKPLLWHIVDRLKYAKTLDEIMIATTNLSQDDAVEGFAKENNLKVYRGSEQDVLDRFVKAAEQENADYIVRITADATLIDPEHIDQIVNKVKQGPHDYVFWDTDTVFEGFEVVSFAALRKSSESLKAGPYREHVTTYIREHPNTVKGVTFQVDPIFYRKNYKGPVKLSVDTLEDFDRMEQIYKKFYKENEIVNVKDALTFFEHA